MLLDISTVIHESWFHIPSRYQHVPCPVETGLLGNDQRFKKKIIYPGAAEMYLGLTIGPWTVKKSGMALRELQGVIWMSARAADTPLIKLFGGRISAEHPISIALTNVGKKHGCKFGTGGGLYVGFFGLRHEGGIRDVGPFANHVIVTCAVFCFSPLCFRSAGTANLHTTSTFVRRREIRKNNSRSTTTSSGICQMGEKVGRGPTKSRGNESN